MDIVREASRLAREFLEEDIRKFELDLAVNGSKYTNTIEEFVEVFGQQNIDSFHHLEFFSDTLDMENDEYIESIKSEKYNIIFDDLDEFLKTKGMTLDRDSAKYLLLARRFVEVKIKSVKHKKNIIMGVPFEYSSIEQSLKTNTTTVESTVKRRPMTIAIQKEINKLAKEIMDKYPKTSKYDLAYEIADKLEAGERFKKSPKGDGIRKKYLSKYPDFQ